MSGFVFPRHIERFPSTPPQAGPVSVGWDLGGEFSQPAVTVLEARPEGLLVRESFVGDAAIEWLREHHPEALGDNAAREGYATLTPVA